MNRTTKTVLVVTIDTEEDNWGRHRSGITCENIGELPRLQELFDTFDILPTYLLSYQVCIDAPAVEILRDIHTQGNCEIGAHLHPWNTPPEEETLGDETSFLKNLPYKLQLKKLTTLTDTIKDRFDLQPRSFRTGRWGLGRNTVDALLQCGYRVDTSVTPSLSWKAEGDGPVFTSVETDPYTLQATRDRETVQKSLLEIPATIGYSRWPFSFWDKIYRLADHPALSPLHLVGALNRTSILRKLWLTPEGFSPEMMIALADMLIGHDKQLLNLSFHSNTLCPGLTPFVQSNRDVDDFYTSLTTLFEYLQQRTELHPRTLTDAASYFIGGIVN